MAFSKNCKKKSWKTAKTAIFISFLVFLMVFVSPLAESIGQGCCIGRYEPGYCNEPNDAGNCLSPQSVLRQDVAHCGQIPECNDYVCCCSGSDKRFLVEGISSIKCKELYQGEPRNPVFGSCANVCIPLPSNEEGSSTFSVEGFVFDQDENPIPGAIVSSRGVSVYTDESGRFFMEITSSSSTVTITARFPSGSVACNQNSKVVSTSHNTNGLFFFLDCLQQYQCTVWSACINGQKTRACEICPESGCDQDLNSFSLARFPEILSFCNDFSGTSFCEDSVVDKQIGETCFVLDKATGEMAPGSECVAELCFNCMCQATELCSGSNCIAPECEFQRPNIIAPLFFSEENEKAMVDIVWGFSGGNCVEYYVIQMCDHNTSVCYNITNLPAERKSYTAFGDVGKTYCFTVFSHFNSEKYSMSEEECIETFKGGCEELHGSGLFCYEMEGNQVIAYCDENNRLAVKDACTTESGGFCLYDKRGSPFCENQNVCETCNNPFSIFGGFSFRLLPFSVFLNPPEIFKLSTISCNDQIEGNNYCYFEKTMTTINKYASCGSVKSCYDYKSKVSCEAEPDPCNKKATIGGCEWVFHDEEIELGICRPLEPEMQSCSECHKEYFDICNYETCPNYAEQCYYNYRGSSSSKCIGTGTDIEMACEYYNNENDCIASNFEIPRNASLEADNKLIPSHDIFGFGTCRWDPEEKTCFKDGDADEYNDCYELPNRFRPAPGIPLGDLINKCYSDNEPPQTKINTERVLFGKELKGLFFSATDNIYFFDSDYSKTQIITYFTLSKEQPMPKGDDVPKATGSVVGKSPIRVELEYPFVYPTKIFPSLRAESPGKYMLWYYSMDIAGNKEVVKGKEIIILPDLEISNIRHNIKDSYNPVSGLWINDLDVSFEVNRPASCMARLTFISGETQNIDLQDTDIKTSFVFSYTNLKGGVYEFRAWCKDEYAETIPDPDEYTIILQNNLGILEIYPKNELFNKKSVPIILKTNETASCRISQTQIKYSEMEISLEGSGTLEHTYTFNAEEDGIYRFYSACSLEKSGVVEGWAEDMVLFAIDTKGPTSSILYSDGALFGQQYNPSERSKELHLKFACNDNYVSNRDENGIYKVYGCKKIIYKINNGISQEFLHNESTDLIFKYEDYVGKPLIAYKAVDFGGNIGEEKTVTLNLANVRPVSLEIKFGR